MTKTTNIRMTAAKQMELLNKLNQLGRAYTFQTSVHTGRFGLFLLFRETLHADELKELEIADRFIYNNHAASQLVSGVMIEDLNEFIEKNRKLARVRLALHQRCESGEKLLDITQIMEDK